MLYIRQHRKLQESHLQGGQEDRGKREYALKANEKFGKSREPNKDTAEWSGPV